MGFAVSRREIGTGGTIGTGGGLFTDLELAFVLPDAIRVAMIAVVGCITAKEV